MSYDDEPSFQVWSTRHETWRTICGRCGIDHTATPDVHLIADPAKLAVERVDPAKLATTADLLKLIERGYIDDGAIESTCLDLHAIDVEATGYRLTAPRYCAPCASRRGALAGAAKTLLGFLRFLALELLGLAKDYLRWTAQSLRGAGRLLVPPPWRRW